MDSNLKKSRGASLTTRDMLSVIAVILVGFITVLFIALTFDTDHPVDPRCRSYFLVVALNIFWLGAMSILKGLDLEIGLEWYIMQG